MLVEEIGFDAVIGQVGHDVGVGDLRTLDHDVAELAGLFESLAFARDGGGLDLHGGPSQTGPGQPGHHPGTRCHQLRQATFTDDLCRPTR